MRERGVDWEEIRDKMDEHFEEHSDHEDDDAVEDHEDHDDDEQMDEQDDGPARNEDGSLDGGVAVPPGSDGQLKSPSDCDLVRGINCTYFYV